MNNLLDCGEEPSLMKYVGIPKINSNNSSNPDLPLY